MNKVAPIDQWIIWVNLAGAAFACGVNIWSARTGWPDWSPPRWTVAAIASLYVAGYTVMAVASPFTVVEASRFMRGISPVAWVAVWAGPPLHAWRIERRLRRKSPADLEAEFLEHRP